MQPESTPSRDAANEQGLSETEISEAVSDFNERINESVTNRSAAIVPGLAREQAKHADTKAYLSMLTEAAEETLRVLGPHKGAHEEQAQTAFPIEDADTFLLDQETGREWGHGDLVALDGEDNPDDLIDFAYRPFKVVRP